VTVEHHPPNDADRVELNDPIARVLKFAGSRPQPDQERKAEFKRALRDEWRRVTEPRPLRRTYGWAAGVAASIAAALVVAWLLPWRITQQPSVTQLVGHVVRSEGIVRRLPTPTASTPSQSVSAGDEVRVDTVLETAETGRLALALDGGISLRIDGGSRIVLLGEKVVRVERGAIYVDSGAEKSGPVLIQTENGDVRDIGTQFEVRAERSSFRVRVREGEVLVSRNDSTMTARAGEALHVDQQGRYVRSTVPVFGPEWAWTSTIAPQFQLEGSTVQQFLEWVAREQGWRWRFVDTDTARRGAGIVTHGSLEGYTPEEALAIVLPTCGLSFVRHRDEVVVSFVKEASYRGNQRAMATPV
jgi:ferric-dicitrate binding protein FerR (iron transport regulator)